MVPPNDLEMLRCNIEQQGDCILIVRFHANDVDHSRIKVDGGKHIGLVAFGVDRQIVDLGEMQIAEYLRQGRCRNLHYGT